MATITRWLLTTAVIVLIGMGGGASAHSLSFDPQNQTTALGGEATVTVRISDVLPAGLGAYDFDVRFDPSILAFDRAIDGFGLGVAIGLGALSGAGTVTVSDFSLESVADLLALQGDAFPLFSLVFDTLAEGTSALGFELVNLGDAAGNPLAPSTLGAGSITVARVVPEPGALALVLAASLAGVAARGRADRRA